MTSTIFAGRGRLSHHLTETGRALYAGLRGHALLYALASGMMIVALIAAIHLDRLFNIQMVLLFSLPVIILSGFAILWAALRELLRLWRSGHQGSATVALVRTIGAQTLAPQRIANVVHAGLLLSLFMTAFTALKTFLPSLNPFQWDTTFMEWDRAVHFGRDPYLILQPVLGYPTVTFGLNLVYNLWFFIMASAWIWQSFAKQDSALRQRFLVAVLVTWFLGTNVLGTIFASVGPVFYGRLLGGPDPYLPLLAYLNETARLVPLWAVDTQNTLWQSYEAGDGLISGISAMPSMHVGSSLLLVFLGFAAGKRWLGWSMLVFTGLIFLGSIHLAWHYAIDGYAGAAVAVAGWYLAGRLVRWDRARQGLADA